MNKIVIDTDALRKHLNNMIEDLDGQRNDGDNGQIPEWLWDAAIAETFEDDYRDSGHSDHSTYFKWEYTLGGDKVASEELDIYEEEPLDVVNAIINRNGATRFYMYSDCNDESAEQLFTEGIKEILSSDAAAAYRASELALGRFVQFDNFLKAKKDI